MAAEIVQKVKASESDAGASRSYRSEESSKGIKNMIFGGLWFVGGSLVTAFTYGAASDGGSYVVAWGAIIFGGGQLLYGLYQYFGSR